MLTWLRDRHWIHAWGEVRIHVSSKTFGCDYLGLFWGWIHRYQRCEHCDRTRLVEGFLRAKGQHYLRSGFTSELT